jgi:hypothetical protein
MRIQIVKRAYMQYLRNDKEYYVETSRGWGIDSKDTMCIEVVKRDFLQCLKKS